MNKWLPLLLLVFIVRWTAAETVNIACPRVESQTDQYGFTGGLNVQHAVACAEVQSRRMERRFNTEAEADEFIKGMPIGQGNRVKDGRWDYNYVTDVEKLEQAEVKP